MMPSGRRRRRWLQAGILLGFAASRIAGADPAPPPAAAKPTKLGCDYRINVEHDLKNGEKQTGVVDKTDIAYVLDPAAQTVTRVNTSYPATFGEDVVRFKIGYVDYTIDRRTLHFSAISKVSSLAGDSVVSEDGSCKLEDGPPLAPK